jgi:hypothetical protein
MGRLGVDAVAPWLDRWRASAGETLAAGVTAVMYVDGTALGNVSGRPSARFLCAIRTQRIY